MRTNITKNLCIDIGVAKTSDLSEILVRLEARAAADGEILSQVTISTEASGKAESLLIDAETIERVAAALGEYRRSQNDYRKVCIDHGYMAPHSYVCAKCSKAEPAVEPEVQPEEGPAF